METQLEKVSYIIGRQIGNDFKNQGLDINADLLKDGFTSALSGGDSKISEEETNTVMQSFQAQMQEKAQEVAAEAGGKNIEVGAEYLANNLKEDGVKTTETGLQYKIIKSGEGKTPTATCTVETHYEGKLIDGTVFDSSYQRNETTTFPVNGVIPGWTEALQLMKEGDVWELTIPSNLAYGENGAGGMIGPNSTLIFKIELVKVM